MIKYILIYLLVVSLITVIVTMYDKKAAKKFKKHRIPENTLLVLAFLGGSVAELLTMHKIRHKTKHKKFMIGLPAIIVLQTIILGAGIYFCFVHQINIF